MTTAVVAATAVLWGISAAAIALWAGARARRRSLFRLSMAEAGRPVAGRAWPLVRSSRGALPVTGPKRRAPPPHGVLYAAGVGLAAGVGWSLVSGNLAWPVIFGGAVAGWFVPGWADGRRRRARLNRLMADLPAVLDLLAIATASGLPLHRAMELVSSRHAGPFSEELRRALDETAGGVRLGRALKNLAERTGLKAARGLAIAVEQATILGAPVAQVLRLQAAAVRTQRRRQAEMVIAGLPLKLSLCTVFFFLPAIFVFVVLPNLLAFIHGRW